MYSTQSPIFLIFFISSIYAVLLIVNSPAVAGTPSVIDRNSTFPPSVAFSRLSAKKRPYVLSALSSVSGPKGGAATADPKDTDLSGAAFCRAPWLRERTTHPAADGKKPKKGDRSATKPSINPYPLARELART